MTRSHHRSLLGSVVRGAVAGAAGTAALDVCNYVMYRAQGGADDPISWEFSAGLERFEDAPAPAKAGRLLAQRAFGVELPDTKARLVNNLTHWGYGIMWAALLGAVTRDRPGGRGRGPVFGSVVWASSYVTLPLLKLYKPIWQYDAMTLAKDLGPHLAYGTVTATVLGAIA